MGLDVYLYRYEDFEKDKQRMEDFDKKKDGLWAAAIGDGDYEDMSEEAKEKYRCDSEELRISMGLGEWGEAGTEINLDSQKYPDHMFKIGYFRSSYNRGGIDSVMRDSCGITLSDIFGVGDEYLVAPEWEAALASAKEARAALANRDRLRAQQIGANPFAAEDLSVLHEADAIDIVREEMAKERGSFQNFSNIHGSFWLGETGLEIVAAVPGKGFLGRPVVYLVYEDSEEGWEWYIQAMDIVIETCEWVLSQDDPSKYALHWSA